MRAALFDLDGVIIDTEPLYSNFWSRIGNEYYPDDKEFAQKLKGQTLTYIFDKFFKNNTYAQNEIRKRLTDFEKSMPFPYIEGAIHFIEKLKELCVPMAVVTSSDKHKMSQLYEAHPELKLLFNRIFTAEDCSLSKPAPDCYLKAATNLGFAPKDCVIFEDSRNGLQAARESGAFVVGLTTSLPQHEIENLCNLSIANFSPQELSYPKLYKLFH